MLFSREGTISERILLLKFGLHRIYRKEGLPTYVQEVRGNLEMYRKGFTAVRAV
jgi:hypothetical protein